MAVEPDDYRFLVSGWEDDLNDIDATRNPEAPDSKALLEACETGNMQQIKTILAKEPALVQVTDKDGYTPLHRASYNKQFEVVTFLLSQGADVTATTEMGWTPLHCCCQWGNVEIAAMLIQNGADINACSNGGQTPLHIAATHGGDYRMVQLLLYHPDVRFHNNCNSETAVDIARRSSKYHRMVDLFEVIKIEAFDELD